jgi:hypothetical protein
MQEEPIANSTETTDLTSPIPIPQGDSCPLLDLNIDAHYELMSNPNPLCSIERFKNRVVIV